jgi:hypothetical protein
MRKGQLGLVELYVVGIALAMGLAACGGLWAYYKSEVKGLETQVTEKQHTIETMGQEKATCLEANAGYSAANKDWKAAVGLQNDAITALKKARDDKAKEALVAKAAAAKQSIVYQGRIKAILAQAEGIDWCKTWAQMMTNYTVIRKEPQ